MDNIIRVTESGSYIMFVDLYELDKFAFTTHYNTYSGKASKFGKAECKKLLKYLIEYADNVTDMFEWFDSECKNSKLKDVWDNLNCTK